MTETTAENTELGFSYEYALDVDLAESLTDPPIWQHLRFSSAIDPQVTPVMKDAATYRDKGAPNQKKVSESWTLAGTVQQHRRPDGDFLPEVERLLELAGPDAVGNKATGRFRWYDDPADGEPNPREAYEGDGTVQMNRQTTGNDDIGGWSFSITGQGRRRRIANPAAEDDPTGPSEPEVDSEGD
ncbi:hypothetical protein FA014_01900 [Cellulomonas hominis]|uniref:Uncharacterized protein n=1 Tax=Cellulomonas hominis TaxID=156981 RepID=A0A7Z8NRW6_9CELL|nr:hypothetical protein [Cellulomonas hominis]TKR27134.1 hypothetical protein FA014_01900 [Cellulomonas hominis]